MKSGRLRRVDGLFVLADALEAKYRAAVERVEKLTPSVLARAFRGELVPQDPGDESAKDLLTRIKAMRDAESESVNASRRGGRATPSVRRAGAKKRGQ
jgi:type I restriction enzyme S subunit